MLWNTLTKRIVLFIEQNPNHTGAKKIKERAYEQMENLGFYINHIDAHNVDILRSLVLEAFPKKLQRLPLKVSQNIHGKWRVDATNQETVK